MSEVFYLLRYEFKKTRSSLVLSGISLVLLAMCVMVPNQTIPPICVFLLTTSLYLTDNFNGYLELVTSMPVKKSSVVIARYIHSFIITVVVSALPLLGGTESYKQIYPFMFLVLSLYVACNLPLVMISYKHSSLVCVLGYLLMLGLTGTFTALSELLGLENLKLDFSISFFSSAKVIIICWMVSLIVALFLFNRFYPKREGK